MLLVHLQGRFAPQGHEAQAHAHGLLGIIFARVPGTEGSEQAVAGVLQYPAVVRLDGRRATHQQAVEHGVDIVGVEPVRQPRRAHRIEKQHRDLAPLLHGLRGHGQCRQLGLKRCQRRIDHAVAQHRTLCLQCCNGVLQGLLRVHLAEVRWPGDARHRARQSQPSQARCNHANAPKMMRPLVWPRAVRHRPPLAFMRFVVRSITGVRSAKIQSASDIHGLKNATNSAEVCTASEYIEARFRGTRVLGTISPKGTDSASACRLNISSASEVASRLAL